MSRPPSPASRWNRKSKTNWGGRREGAGNPGVSRAQKHDEANMVEMVVRIPLKYLEILESVQFEDETILETIAKAVKRGAVQLSYCRQSAQTKAFKRAMKLRSDAQRKIAEKQLALEGKSLPSHEQPVHD